MLTFSHHNQSPPSIAVPLTRRPIMLICDSDTASHFMRVRSPFGAPFVALLSPAMYPEGMERARLMVSPLYDENSATQESQQGRISTVNMFILSLLQRVLWESIYPLLNGSADGHCPSHWCRDWQLDRAMRGGGETRRGCMFESIVSVPIVFDHSHPCSILSQSFVVSPHPWTHQRRRTMMTLCAIGMRLHLMISPLCSLPATASVAPCSLDANVCPRMLRIGPLAPRPSRVILMLHRWGWISFGRQRKRGILTQRVIRSCLRL